MTKEYDAEESIRFALRDWQLDQVRFSRTICSFSRQIANSVGYTIAIDEHALELVHQNWVALQAVWQKERVQSGQRLSEMKQISLLLYHLASVHWIEETFDSRPIPQGYFADKPDLWNDIRKALAGAPECYLGLQFATKFINAVEEARSDREEEFVFRLTPDLQHDIIVFLKSEARDPLSLFLILKALYSRLGGHPN